MKIKRSIFSTICIFFAVFIVIRLKPFKSIEENSKAEILSSEHETNRAKPVIREIGK